MSSNEPQDHRLKQFGLKTITQELGLSSQQSGLPADFELKPRTSNVTWTSNCAAYPPDLGFVSSHGLVGQSNNVFTDRNRHTWIIICISYCCSFSGEPRIVYPKYTILSCSPMWKHWLSCHTIKCHVMWIIVNVMENRFCLFSVFHIKPTEFSNVVRKKRARGFTPITSFWSLNKPLK